MKAKQDSYASTYNDLGDVKEAWELANADPDRFEAFLESACTTAANSGLEKDFGIFLLHRHWDVLSGEIMCESSGILSSGEAALITRARSRTDPEASYAAPSRWQLLLNKQRPQLMPLEFSSDSAAIALSNKVYEQSVAPFVDSYFAVLSEFGFQGLLGLTSLTRVTLVPEGDKQLVEENVDSESVVTAKYVPADDEEQHIPTAWRLWREPHLGCVSRCKCKLRCCYCVHGPAARCRHQRHGHGPRHEWILCRPTGCVRSLQP